MATAAVPKTLTRQEFMRTPAARKPGATYEGYLRFVARRRASRTTAADPFAATPEPQLRSRVTSDVRAQVDPIIAEILKGTDTQASGIEAVTNRYAGSLGRFEEGTRSRYGRSKAELAAVAEGMANRLGASGAAVSSELSGKLAAINAPAAQVAGVAGGAAGFARGAANAGFGIDSAALEELISRAAGAEDFAAALPGYARMEGIGRIADLRSASEKDVRELRAKVPGLVAELLGKERDRELDKAIARAGFQQDSAERQSRASAAAAEAAQPDASLSNSLGYLVDSNGIPLLDAAGKPIPAGPNAPGRKNAAGAGRGKAVKARTDAEVAAVQTARELARELYKGEKVSTGGGLVPGAAQVKRKTLGEALRIILNEINPSLARYGVRPGSDRYARVRAQVIDALLDAGFKAGAANPTKRKPGATYDKPRG